MTNEIQTRRLIVTLPNTSGEESDELAAALEYEASERQGITGATVTHALGETLPDSVQVSRGTDPRIYLQVAEADAWWTTPLTADEARQLAGVLLAHAHTIDPNQEA